jgi:hypothetical protein
MKVTIINGYGWQLAFDFMQTVYREMNPVKIRYLSYGPETHNWDVFEKGCNYFD